VDSALAISVASLVIAAASLPTSYFVAVRQVRQEEKHPSPDEEFTRRTADFL
jgi:hypothetical protein